MIVPQYWAEARVQHRERGRQMTLRRFGWSDASQDEAQANAERRVQEALARRLAGERLAPREPRVPYNGADGVPIREEIVARHGPVVITRNAYGARCLNTPDVLFADIDFDERAPLRTTLASLGLLMLVALLVGWQFESRIPLVLLLLVAALGAGALAGRLHRLLLDLGGGAEGVARQRIARFVAANPAWNLRLYRTPAGLRVMATQQTFAPDDPAVARCFAALGADPRYARMCLSQQCFRARVSAKPWRIGIADHLRPRPGVWPVAAEHLPLRREWIERYESAAQGFAACRFVESLGSGVVAPAVAEVQRLHDELCGAATGLPIA